MSLFSENKFYKTVFLASHAKDDQELMRRVTLRIFWKTKTDKQKCYISFHNFRSGYYANCHYLLLSLSFADAICVDNM